MILEIALGIVLGGFLLVNLDAILGLGIVLAVVAVVLCALAVAGYLLLNNWVPVAVVVTGIIAIFAIHLLREKLNPKHKRDLTERIKSREMLGYDATNDREELAKQMMQRPTKVKLPPGGTPELERERRRLLGYSD